MKKSNAILKKMFLFPFTGVLTTTGCTYSEEKNKYRTSFKNIVQNYKKNKIYNIKNARVTVQIPTKLILYSLTLNSFKGTVH